MTTTGTTAAPVARDRRALRRLLIAVVVAGLLVDVYVHWHLAARFDGLKGSGTPQISQGLLFRVEAVAALLAVVLMLLVRRRISALVALLVAGGGCAVVLLYALVDVGAVGPVPDMYDPSWYAEKTISAVAEAAAAIAALVFLVLPGSGARGGGSAGQAGDSSS
ncbi:MAG: hypothetical protein ABJA34_01770 [Pseudonocardiales bacterium]